MRNIAGMKGAMILGFALVFGLGLTACAQVLSGSWDTTATVEPSPVTLGIDSEVIVNYSVDTWTFSSDTGLDETGWTQQSFTASGTLGQFAFASRLVFAPSTPAAFFSQWVTTGTVSIGGVTMISTFSLAPDDVQLVLDVSGDIGSVGARAVVSLGDVTPEGGCDFGWQDVVATIDFPFCCAEVTSALSVSCSGFEKMTFKVEDISISAIAWVTLDALLTFEPDDKSLVLTPTFDFGVDPCFNLYIGIADDSVLFPDFTLDGIGLTCLVEGIQFTGQSYWGTGTKPSLLTGTSYWEAYQIMTTDDSCCGPFAFEVTIYFDHGDQLFDVAEIDADLSVQIGDPFVFSTGIAIDLAASPAAFTEWTLGFLVTW